MPLRMPRYYVFIRINPLHFRTTLRRDRMRITNVFYQNKTFLTEVGTQAVGGVGPGAWTVAGETEPLLRFIVCTAFVFHGAEMRAESCSTAH